MSEWLTLQTPDGPMTAYAAGGPDAHGTVVVLMEAFGVTPHITEVCDRLAAAGWRALAPDLYHRTAPGQVFDESQMEEVMRHYGAVTTEGFLMDWDALSAELRPPAAVIGFCMGGRWAFVAACERGAQLFGAVSFYGGGIEHELERCQRLRIPVRLIYGEEDGLIPAEARSATERALQQAGANYRVSLYPAGHGFMCPQRDSYAADSAREAWEELINFLESLRS